MNSRTLFAFLLGIALGAPLAFLAMHPSYAIWSREELLADIVNRDQAKAIVEHHWRLAYELGTRLTNEELAAAGRNPAPLAFWVELEKEKAKEFADIRQEFKKGLVQDYEGFTLLELMESRDFLLSPTQMRAAAYEVQYAKRNAELNGFFRQEFQDLAVSFYKTRAGI